MNSTSECLMRNDTRAEPRGLAPLAQRFVLSRLEGLQHGLLEVVLADGSRRLFGDLEGEHRATFVVHDPRCFARLLRAADTGIGEAFMAGEWSTPDLVGLVRLFLANEELLEPAPWLGAVALTRDRLLHFLRSNTRSGSRRNITAHYDLSNDLYALFLDPSMTYSAAVFPEVGASLEQAQRTKYRRLADSIGLQPGQHVLEIGCGWGGFAEVAALDYGCQVTGLTLSTEQADYARQRMARLGLERQVEIRLEDYRDARGSFDAVVSIEMLEAVGHRFLGGFFAACERLLAPAGRMALQVITIPDQLYDRYRHGTDWIRRYIFPGGHLPSLGALQTAMARSSRFTVEHLDDIAAHYAETLRLWRLNFMRDLDAVRRLGFDDTFIRMWKFYLASCEALFAHRKLATLQLVLARPGVTTNHLPTTAPTAPPGRYGRLIDPYRGHAGAPPRATVS